MSPKVFLPVSLEARQQYWPTDPIERLHRIAEVIEPDSPNAPWDACNEVDGLVVGWGAPRLPVKVWRRLDSLRIISVFGGSASYIEELIEAIQRGIVLANASPEMGEAVAESTLALILAGQYGLVASSAAYGASGELSGDGGQPNRSLTGATVGIIGLGFIGRKVAELLRPFAVQLLVYDPYVGPEQIEGAGGRPVSLEALLRQADVVSLHAGWTKETSGMLGPQQLDLLKPAALVVSTARMPIFNQHALAQRVLSGKVRFASDFIPYDPTVWATPEMRTSPHLIAVHGHTSVTHRSLYRMAQRVVTNIEQVFAGEDPDNKITEEWIRRTT
ncbi:MAG: NAD(P)-dependent oxidoreductase [bacterium]|nr:NAD(P)-dependent oxidoreductase [bacterium]